MARHGVQPLSPDGLTASASSKRTSYDGTTLTARTLYTSVMFKPETKALSTSFLDKIKGCSEILAGKATGSEAPRHCSG